MANYSVLFGGAQPQQANVAGAMNQGGLDAQKIQANRQSLAAAPVALEGQKLQNETSRRSLDMSASQSLSNTFKQLAAIPDDNKRNQIYKSIIPHLKKLSPDKPYPDTLSADDANTAAQAFAMAGSGGITKEQLEQRQLEFKQQGMDQRAQQFNRVMQMREKELNAPRQQMMPSAVQEWEYFNRLSPEQQTEYNAMKRGTPGYSSTTEKQIYGASDAYVEDNAAYENYSDLASRYEQANGQLMSGKAGTLTEWLKEQTGNQDEMTLLRKDWSKLKASELVNNLPPGAASDADILLAKEGFLPTNAEPKAVASFLRGVAKLRKLNAEYSAFKADYLSEKKNPGGLRKAWQEKASQSGVNVPTNSSANQSASGPQAGMVEDGYRFKGGNPSDPNSWEKVQ